jgi:tetratricopeptide (TPR) repeat protein
MWCSAKEAKIPVASDSFREQEIASQRYKKREETTIRLGDWANRCVYLRYPPGPFSLLRKYGDFLRNRGHLNFARDVLLEALRLSGRGRGTRQRIYILGCLGDLERQRKNYAAALEHFDRAIELARATFIPGWLGNLHLGLAELALDRNRFDEARISLEQAEAHYRNTHPKHWWGEIQVGLSRCRIMQISGSQD